MKHLLLILLLLTASLGRGQVLVPGQLTSITDQRERSQSLTAFADSINRIFRGVDKSRVSSGILEEYGLQFIDHMPFTGTNGYTDANQLDINRWRALYGDLYGSRINSNAQVPSLSAVNQRMALYGSDANIELPILHFNYHSIRSDALSSGRIQSVNNRLYDVAGQDPYQLNTAFAVAASDAALLSATGNFIFRSDLFWTNTGRTVATLQADFADGNGFVAMSWNVARTVSYATAGLKDIRVQVSYTDGSTWQSHLQVLAPTPVTSPNSAARQTTATYSGIADVSETVIATKAYQGVMGSALVTVEYSGTPGVLDKPLIIVKGFDVSGIIPLGPTPYSPTGRFNYSSYIQDTFNKPNAGGSFLGNGAYQDGYDIVYVDFNDGVDYVQRNAYLLEAVIKWVNQRKTGSQPNAMMGLSMGGLIAQYALRDIEEAGSTANNDAYPHQVGLLITHDSPHQGANVPLSIQLLIRELAGTVLRLPIGDDVVLTDRFPALLQARNALLSPAAQQLLRYQTTRSVRGVGRNVYGGPVAAAETSLYDAFQREYQDKLGPAHVPVGTPGLPCRVVAVSNGTECGRPQPYGPYALLVSLTSTSNIANFGLLDALRYTILSSAGSGVAYGIGFLSGPVAIATAGLVSLFSLGLTGAYDLTAALDLRALPDRQALPICGVFLQVNKRTRLFGLFRVQFDLLEFHRSSLASELPLDSGSGSIISLADYGAQLGGATSAIPPGAIKQTQFCFEPTYSALNITPSGPASLTAQYSPGTQVNTPFANFRTATRNNESHVQYTDPNSSWMLKELRQTPQVLSCQDFCQSNPTISGPRTICYNGATYSINGLPSGTTITWQLVTTTYVTSTGTVGPTFTVGSSSSPGGASGTLTATIASDCGNLMLTIPVYIGGPPIPTVIVEGQSDCDRIAGLRITNYNPALTYTTSGNGVMNVNSQGFFQLRGYAQGYNAYTVTAANSCGTTSTTNQYVVFGSCNHFTMYPNPANEEVEVYQGDNSTEASAQFASARAWADTDTPITVRIYDGQGQLQLEQQGSAQLRMHLVTTALPAGLYMVHILQGSEVVSRQQLQIQR